MSGPIIDLPVRVCNRCPAVFIEDEQMYEEPGRCPHCGAYLNDGPAAAGDLADPVIEL